MITTVQLKIGSVDEIAQLFQETNPDLVRLEQDWVSGRMSVDRKTNKIQVSAIWKRLESYDAFSKSEAFQIVMKGFVPHFAGPPVIEKFEVLQEMMRNGMEVELR